MVAGHQGSASACSTAATSGPGTRALGDAGAGVAAAAGAGAEGAGADEDEDGNEDAFDAAAAAEGAGDGAGAGAGAVGFIVVADAVVTAVGREGRCTPTDPSSGVAEAEEAVAYGAAEAWEGFATSGPATPCSEDAEAAGAAAAAAVAVPGRESERGWSMPARALRSAHAASIAVGTRSNVPSYLAQTNKRKKYEHRGEEEEIYSAYDLAWGKMKMRTTNGQAGKAAYKATTKTHRQLKSANAKRS